MARSRTPNRDRELPPAKAAAVKVARLRVKVGDLENRLKPWLGDHSPTASTAMLPQRDGRGRLGMSSQGVKSSSTCVSTAIRFLREADVAMGMAVSALSVLPDHVGRAK